MLTQLSIRNFTIIHSLDIELDVGFNVLTGETASGKSLILQALQVLLGSKFQQDLLSKDHSRGYVAGSFVVSSTHPACHWLSQADIPYDTSDSTSIVLRRNFSRGRTFATCNDTPITLETLKKIGSSLVDMAAQHESMALLNETNHLPLMDLESFHIHRTNVSKAYLTAYTTYNQLQTLMNEFAAQRTQRDYSNIVSIACKSSIQVVLIIKNFWITAEKPKQLRNCQQLDEAQTCLTSRGSTYLRLFGGSLIAYPQISICLQTKLQQLLTPWLLRLTSDCLLWKMALNLLRNPSGD